MKKTIMHDRKPEGGICNPEAYMAVRLSEDWRCYVDNIFLVRNSDTYESLLAPDNRRLYAIDVVCANSDYEEPQSLRVIAPLDEGFDEELHLCLYTELEDYELMEADFGEIRAYAGSEGVLLACDEVGFKVSRSVQPAPSQLVQEHWGGALKRLSPYAHVSDRTEWQIAD